MNPEISFRNAGVTQITQTDKFVNERWVKNSHPTGRHKLTPRKHYRLVTRGAGFRLSTFKGTKELLSATYDVLIGKVSIRHIGPPLSAFNLSRDGRALESGDLAQGPQHW